MHINGEGIQKLDYINKKKFIINKKFAKVFSVISTIIVVLIGMLAVLIGKSLQWMLKTWDNLTMEELVYHLQAPLEGTNEGMIKNYIYSCGIITVVIGVLIIILFVSIRKKKKIYYMSMAGVVLISAFIIGISLQHVWTELDIATYQSNQRTYSSFIDDNYIDPKKVQLTFPQEKRNLIYIYLESMEVTYADKTSGGGFEKNVIEELTNLSKQYENFSGGHDKLNGGYAMTGSTWTIGAMFAQSTGLPLILPIENNSMGTQKEFLPEVTAIGDILDKAGYSQTLLIGSGAEFGGRDLFYSQHGNYDIRDYYYSLKTGELPPDYSVWWGYEDKKLFEHAKSTLLELSESDEPFNLTMLTVDTHFEDGYLCEDCENKFGNDKYSNVMACSSAKVEELVHWIQEQDFYDNTTIVISGDHPTMDSDFCDKAEEDYIRKVYTAYINSAVSVENNTYREFSTFDNFPTALASIGVEIEGERLGLGTNLFSSTQTLSERFGRDVVDTELGKKSVLVESLTSGIMDPEELKIKDETENAETNTADKKQITSEVTVYPYNYKKGKYKVVISDIQSENEIQAVRCAVWSESDQSDLIWYEAEKNVEGLYEISVKASDFSFRKGNYNIHIYVVDDSGNQEMTADAIGVID